MAEQGMGQGGAEGAQRMKQYEYRANSNLVLTAENRSARTNEATGEPETLWGIMKQKDMVRCLSNTFFPPPKRDVGRHPPPPPPARYST